MLFYETSLVSKVLKSEFTKDSRMFEIEGSTEMGR